MPVLTSRLLFRGLRRGQIQRLIRTILALQAQDAARLAGVAVGKVPVYFATPGGPTAFQLSALLATAQAALAARS